MTPSRDERIRKQTDEPPTEPDRNIHADRADAAPSPWDPDRGASKMTSGPTEAPGNKGWDAPEAEAPESLEGAIRRGDDPQNGAPIYPGSEDDVHHAHVDVHGRGNLIASGGVNEDGVTTDGPATGENRTAQGHQTRADASSPPGLAAVG